MGEHMNADRHYHIMYTMPKGEKKVAHYLESLGVEYYLPIIPTRRKWSDRIKIVDLPLFPGYIFVNLTSKSMYSRALQHPLAKMYLFEKQEPALLTDLDLDPIRLMVDSKVDLETEPVRKFQSGQLVRVLSGALAGVEGVVEKIRGTKKIFVRVPFLNQMISAEIDPGNLEPISEAVAM